jgi:ribonuclease E
VLIEEEEEPEFVEALDETEEVEAAGETEAAEQSEQIEGVPQPMHGDGGREGEIGREGGRGRRRRRRGRGRGGEGREPSAFPQPRREQAAFEPGEIGPDQAASFAQPGGDESVPGAQPPEERFAQPHPDGGETHANGNGEHRRRRRGRRGGRRNRRDREGQEIGDFAAAPGLERQERPEWSERHEPQVSDQATHVAEPTYAPRFEPAAPPPVMPEPALVSAPPPSPEPQRRRSTVREPAPVFSGESAPVVMPMPAPQPVPMPAPIVSSSAETDDASKPRRTGWWAKRLLGGDKG